MCALKHAHVCMHPSVGIHRFLEAFGISLLNMFLRDPYLLYLYFFFTPFNSRDYRVVLRVPGMGLQSGKEKSETTMTAKGRDLGHLLLL